MTIILPQKSRNTIAIRFLVLELRAIRSIFRLIAVGVVELTRTIGWEAGLPPPSPHTTGRTHRIRRFPLMG